MRVILSALSFFVSILYVVSQPIQSYNWQNVVINGGGYVPGFVYSKATKNLLYARTDVGGAYRWDPSNRRWIPLSDFVTSANQLGVISMAADPIDSNRVYMVTGLYTNSWDPNGVFFSSRDKGNTWIRYEMPCKVGGNEAGRGTGERLQVDPNLPNKLYFASQEQGLFQSLDYGATWTKVTSFPRNNCTFLEIDPNFRTSGNASRDIYIGTYDHLAGRDTTVGGLYRSIDGGISWAYWAGQFPKVEPKDFDNPRISTPAIPNNLVFAGNNIFITMGNNLAPGTSNGYVVRFNRLTNTWTKIYPFSRNTQGGYNSLTVHPTNPNIVMVGTLGHWWPTSDRIYITTNAGTSWTDVRTKMKTDTKNTPHGGGMGWNSGLKINPFNPSEALFGSGNGLWMTNNLDRAFTNDSTLWVYENDNFEETVPLALASPPSGAELISGLGDIKGFVHLDVTKSPADSYHHHGNSYSVDFAENDPRIIVRTHDGGRRASISRNNGVTWNDFATQAIGGDTRTNYISISPNGINIVWAPSDSFPSVSSNGGASWSLCNGLAENVFPKSDRVNSSIFYAIDNATDNATGFFFRSTDGARTFSRTATSFPFTGGMNIVPVFGNEGHVWLSAGVNGLHFTTNGGVSFNKISAVDEAYRVTFGKAAPSSTYPSVFIYGKIDGIVGLFRSDNIGSTWIKINTKNQEFGRGFNRGISGDPKIYGRLYLGTDGRGIIYGDVQGTGICYTPNLGEEQTICKSSVITLRPNIPASGYTYRWTKDGIQMGSTASVLGISLPGTYMVTASIAGCPIKSNAIQVDTKLLPVNSPSICPGQSATMTVTVPSTYAWYSSANVPIDTANFLTVSPLTTTSYFVKDIATTVTTLGQPTYSSGGWGIGNSFNSGQNQVRLTVLDDITLKSISLFVLGAGTNGVIRILDLNGNVVTFARRNGLAAGLQPISFNDFKLLPGEYLLDAVSTTGFVQFQTDRTNAKFSIPNYATMTPVPGWAYGIFFNLTFEIGNTCTPTPTTVFVSNPPLVTITSTGRTFCQGQSLRLTASTGSSYLWRNGTVTVSSSAFLLATASGAYTVEVGDAIGCKGTSPIWTVTAIPSFLSTVSITSSISTVCSGTGVSLTATGTNIGTAPIFTWFRNNISQGTGRSFSYSPSNGDVIRAIATAAGTLPTCLTGSPATSNGINLTVNPIQTASVSIVSSVTTVCSGTGVTFTATGVNAGTAPVYTWFRNNVSQGTGTTFTYTPSNGDVIRAIATAAGTLPTCLTGSPATSNGINLTVNPIQTASISIVSSATTVCSGTGVTFTATGTNAGSVPVYTWFRNNVSQGTGLIFTYTPSNGDVIRAVATAGGILPACLTGSPATSNGINLTVNPIQTASVSIVSSATTVCSGTGVTFTATGTNVGSAPVYTWFRNNVSQGTGQTFTYTPSNGDVIRAIATAGGTLPVCLTGSPATSNGINLTVNPIQTASVSIVSSATNVCSGTGVTFTATGTNVGSAPAFTWFRNNVSQGTGSTFTYAPSNGDVIRAIATAAGTLPTCLTGSPATSNGINLTVNPIQTASVSIVSSVTNVCSGTGVTFTATGTNVGSVPMNTWFRSNISQGTGTTFTYIPSNGDVIRAIATVGGTLPACLTGSPATSNGINLTVNPIQTASVSIVSSATNVCSGTGVTFTATGVNAGTAPVYTWFRNNVSQGTGTTFTYSPSNGDVIRAIATAAGTLPTCLTGSPATSNGINLTVNPIQTASVSIVSSPTTVCSGTGVTFTSTGVNAGTAPVYTWFRNNISQGTGTTFSYLPSNGDVIRAIATANGTLPTCLTGSPATSNGINLTVNPIQTASVSIVSSATTICSGTGVTFTATGVNAGTAPVYTWFRNHISHGTGRTFTYTPSNSDVIKAIATVGGALPACLTGSLATSNGINLTVNPLLTPSVSVIASANTVCSGTGVSFTAVGVNLGNSPVYSWFVNNAFRSNGTNFSFVPANGDLVKVNVSTSGTCLSTNIAQSSVTQITVNAPVLASVSISPSANPTCSGTGVVYSASAVNAGTSPMYVWRVNGNVVSGNSSALTYTPSNNDLISVSILAGGTLPNCLVNATATSTGVTALVNGTIATSLKIAPNSNNFCQGALVTFNTTASGTGSLPTYNWFVNNVLSTATGVTFSYIPSQGDVVKATMTPGGNGITCIIGGTTTAVGNALTVQNPVVASVSILSPTSTYCAGNLASFTANAVNGGSLPVYTWYVNGQIQSAGPTFSYSPTNNDQVVAELAAGGTLPNCLVSIAATSSGLNISVDPTISAGISILSSASEVCTNTGVSFTATGMNAGSSPVIQWYLNNFQVSTGTNYNYIPSNGDIVYAKLNVGGNLTNCLTNTTAVSSIIGLTVNPCLSPQVASITGPGFVLDGTTGITYSVPVVSGDSYLWNVPSGATIVNGQGTNSITVDFGNSVAGNISLTQTNINGSTQVQLYVQSGQVPLLGSISGVSSVIANQTGVVYTVNSVPGTNYQWTVPAGATIVSGQGTNSIVVDFGPSVTGTVSVLGSNSFGSGGVSLAITEAIPTGPDVDMAFANVNIYPNPSNADFILESPQGELLITDLHGVELEKRKHTLVSKIGADYPAGVYFIQIKNMQGVVKIFRVVKLN